MRNSISNATGFVRRHFDLFTDGETGAFHGVFIKFPGLPFSAFVEWREQNVGWAVEREPGHVKVWAGRLEGSFCREPKGFQMGREVR